MTTPLPPLAPVYLNDAGSTWPKAPGVAEAVHAATLRMPETSGGLPESEGGTEDACRVGLAELLGGVPPSQVVLTASATHALNVALLGLPLPPRARVLTTVTEHDSVLSPLHHLESERGTQLTVLGLDESLALDLRAFDRALAEGPPDLVVVNHVSQVTGRIHDVRRMFERAKASGSITALDASQSLGRIPVHPAELFADLVAFSGHKGLRGPLGTGGLYVAPTVRLEHVLVGGPNSPGTRLRHPSEMPARLQAGPPNVPAMAGLSVAVKWALREGAATFVREQRLAAAMREQLLSMPGVWVFDGSGQVPRVGVMSFALERYTVAEVGYILKESFGLECRTGLHAAPLHHDALGSAPEGTVRFSVSGCTTDEEGMRAVHAVQRLVS